MYAKTSVLLSLALMVAVSVGCATYQHGQIDTKAVDAYSSSSSIGGITIAADAYDTTEKAKQVFYEDVLSKCFHPIQLIIQNNTKDRIIILKETVELIDASENSFRPVSSVIMSDACQHNKMAYALLGFGIFSYMSAEEANKKMAADWRDKELADQVMVEPGRKKDGFLYFKLPEGKTTKGSKLRFTGEKLESKENISFEINM